MPLLVVAALAAGWFAFWTSDARSPIPVSVNGRCLHGGLRRVTFFGGPSPVFAAFKTHGQFAVSVAGPGHVQLRIDGRVAAAGRTRGCSTMTTELRGTHRGGIELGVGTRLVGVAGAITADPPPAAPRVVFLGDSITLGAGGEAPSGYAYRAGWAKGWDVHLDAQVGTGFLNRAGAQSYAQRLPAVLAQHPSTLVVAGGINDFRNFPNVEIARAAAALFARVKASGARLIVLSPWQPPRFKVSAYRDLSARIAKAAIVTGARYIDTSTWLTPRLMSPDGIHPNERGYRAIAAKLALRL